MTSLMEDNRVLDKGINILNRKKKENTDKIARLVEETKEMAEALLAENIDNGVVEINDEVNENIDNSVVEINDKVTDFNQ